jgi:hypothetical protein
MRTCQHQATRNTDDYFARFGPGIVAPDRRRAEHHDGDESQANDPCPAVQAIPHQQADETRRHDEP